MTSREQWRDFNIEHYLVAWLYNNKLAARVKYLHYLTLPTSLIIVEGCFIWVALWLLTDCLKNFFLPGLIRNGWGGGDFSKRVDVDFVILLLDLMGESLAKFS